MMRPAFSLLLALIFIFAVTGCKKDEGLTEAEVREGLKEALRVGTNNSVDDAKKTDGYFANSLIKIPFPEEAEIVETTLRGIGADALVDDVVLQLNRAAEDAAEEARPIFIDAIAGITIDDAFGILNGGDNAATNYLEGKTRTSLHSLFKPKIQTSLDNVGASQAWTTCMDAYNTIPLVQPVNTDLPEYTTIRALDGLFVLVAQEEKDIRQNPAARINDILRKVFGS